MHNGTPVIGAEHRYVWCLLIGAGVGARPDTSFIQGFYNEISVSLCFTTQLILIVYSCILLQLEATRKQTCLFET